MHKLSNKKHKLNMKETPMKLHIKFIQSERTDDFTNFTDLKLMGNNPQFGFYWWFWVPFFQKQYKGFDIFLFCYCCTIYVTPEPTKRNK